MSEVLSFSVLTLACLHSVICNNCHPLIHFVPQIRCEGTCQRLHDGFYSAQRSSLHLDQVFVSSTTGTAAASTLDARSVT